MMEWIDAAHDLPEYGRAVLVHVNTGIVTVAFRKKAKPYNQWRLFGDIDNIVGLTENDFVTHWMPLPSPPQN